jgi:hypothetical protein
LTGKSWYHGVMTPDLANTLLRLHPLPKGPRWADSSELWERVLWHFGESARSGDFTTQWNPPVPTSVVNGVKIYHGPVLSSGQVLLWKDHVWCGLLGVWLPGLENARQQFHAQQTKDTKGQGETTVFLSDDRPCRKYPPRLGSTDVLAPELVVWVDTMVAHMARHQLDGELPSPSFPLPSRRRL